VRGLAFARGTALLRSDGLRGSAKVRAVPLRYALNASPLVIRLRSDGQD
jgi:hypothetical protein